MIPPEDLPSLVDEFRRQPYGRHSPGLHVLLTWLRTRLRDRKIVLLRDPDQTSLRVCELGGVGPELTPLIPGHFKSLEDAERAVFEILLQENRSKLAQLFGGYP